MVDIKESIEWSDFDGVYLPTKILGEKMVPKSGPRTPDTPPEYTAEYYEANFEWKVVNDAKKLPSFGRELLDDVNQLTRFVGGDQDDRSKD